MNKRNHPTWTAERESVRRQRGRRHGWGGPAGGPPPWVGQMFGPQLGGPGGGRGRRSRVRRGDVRSAILHVLAEAPEPINGYQVIQQIAERTDEAWKPSPGSVYPTLAQLQDEGLVEDAPAGRKTVRLTEAGRTYVTENADEIARIWAAFDEEGPEDAADLKQVIGQTMAAVYQVASTGTPGQRAQAVEVLADTRRRLYGILAEGPEAAEQA